MASSCTLACPAQRHGDALVDTAVPQVPSWAVHLRRSCRKALPILRMAQEVYTRGSPSTDGEKGCRAQPGVCARLAERGWHDAPCAPREKQPCVVWCVQGRVRQEFRDVQTPPGTQPHRGTGWRTSHAREEDVMDHPDDPAAATT